MKSKGLGDTIYKITKATGIKKVVDKVSKATGKGFIWLGNKIASLWIKALKLWNKGVSSLIICSACDGTCCKKCNK